MLLLVLCILFLQGYAMEGSGGSTMEGEGSCIPLDLESTELKGE